MADIDLFKAHEVMSGSYGTCMMNGKVVAEVFEWKAEIKIDRKDIIFLAVKKGKK